MRIARGRSAICAGAVQRTSREVYSIFHRRTGGTSPSRGEGELHPPRGTLSDQRFSALRSLAVSAIVAPAAFRPRQVLPDQPWFLVRRTAALEPRGMAPLQGNPLASLEQLERPQCSETPSARRGRSRTPFCLPGKRVPSLIQDLAETAQCANLHPDRNEIRRQFCL